MLLLNPHQNANVLLPKLLHKTVILTVHQLIMTPLLITLEIPHMKYMYHKLTTRGKVMQEKMGKSL